MPLPLSLGCWGTEEGIVGPVRVVLAFLFSSSQPHLVCPPCSFLPLPFSCVSLSSFLIKTLNPISFHIDHGSRVVFANSFYVPSASLFNLFYCLVSLKIALQVKDCPVVQTWTMPCQVQIQFCLSPAPSHRQNRETPRASWSTVKLKSIKLCIKFAFLPRGLGLSHGTVPLGSWDLVSLEWHDWIWSIAKKRSQWQSICQQYRLKRLAFQKREALNPRNKAFTKTLSSRAWSFISLTYGNWNRGKHLCFVSWSILMATDSAPWRGAEASCLWCALWLLGRSLSFLLPTGDGVRCSFSGPSDGFPSTTQQTNQTPKSSTVAGLLEAAVEKHLFVGSPTNWSGWPMQWSEKGADLVECV